MNLQTRRLSPKTHTDNIHTFVHTYVCMYVCTVYLSFFSLRANIISLCHTISKKKKKKKQQKKTLSYLASALFFFFFVFLLVNGDFCCWSVGLHVVELFKYFNWAAAAAVACFLLINIKNKILFVFVFSFLAFVCMCCVCVFHVKNCKILCTMLAPCVKKKEKKTVVKSENPSDEL